MRCFLGSVVLALLLSACGPASDSTRLAGKELVVLTRHGPTCYFDGPDGSPAGLEHDLALMFGQYLGRRVRFEFANSVSDVAPRVAARGASFAAAALPREQGTLPGVVWGPSYQTVAPMVVYNTEHAAPRDWADLGRAELGLVKGFGHARIVEEAKRLAPELNPQPFELEDVEPLLERVAHATLPFAIADAQSIALLRNIYIDIDGAFVAGAPRELAWLFAPGEEELVEQARAFFRMIRENGTLQRLLDRYYGHVLRVEPNDASLMHERIRSVLPQFRSDFQYAQELTGIEWRLLAAVAYQESHWDPLATSPTNVRGIMMLTEDTAQRMNVLDRLDPRQSIMAGAKYLVELKRMLPDRILEPDRTWIALAAYNIGFAHLEDARVLAQRRKLNPDAWTDLKKALPMLAFPEQAKNLRHGYARGGAPVIFVENVRAYYDLLNRMEQPHLPKLHAPRKCTAAQLRAC